MKHRERLLTAEVDISLLFWNTFDVHLKSRMEDFWLSEGSLCRRSCRYSIRLSQWRPVSGYEYAH